MLPQHSPDFVHGLSLRSCDRRAAGFFIRLYHNCPCVARRNPAFETVKCRKCKIPVHRRALFLQGLYTGPQRITAILHRLYRRMVDNGALPRYNRTVPSERNRGGRVAAESTQNSRTTAKKGEEITYETYRCDYLRCGYGSEPGCLQHHRQQLFRFHR